MLRILADADDPDIFDCCAAAAAARRGNFRSFSRKKSSTGEEQISGYMAFLTANRQTQDSAVIKRASCLNCKSITSSAFFEDLLRTSSLPCVETRSLTLHGLVFYYYCAWWLHVWAHTERERESVCLNQPDKIGEVRLDISSDALTQVAVAELCSLAPF